MAHRSGKIRELLLRWGCQERKFSMWRRRAKEKGLNARAPAETENRLKELPEMPAKTRYLEWGGNCMVCEDWVVVGAVCGEPVSLLFGQYQRDFQKNSVRGP
jgi:hypothetical protein